MRTLIVLVAIAGALTAAGVIHFQKNGNQVNISVDEDKLRETGSKVVAEGQQLVGEAEHALEQKSAPATPSSAQWPASQYPTR